ncbi:MAG: sialidase family protein [Chitinophagales bacterium]
MAWLIRTGSASIILLVFILFSSGRLEAQPFKVSYLFKNHSDGYPMFRIPTVITAGSGRILAFCEGRKSLFDSGDIDLVMKTSDDQGKTWSPLQVIWNDGSNTCGNPTPVLDRTNGDVIVVATLNNDSVFVLRSANEGKHWETPVNITASVKPDSWKWYASGPVHAIQLEQATYKNRLMIPCNHTLTKPGKHIAHIIYSDDSGKTWHLGGSVPADDTDESTVAELTNGELLLNMRNSDRTWLSRKVSHSTDGGLTWSVPVFDSVLIEPVCQGSLLRYSQMPDILLFSNPRHTKQRKNLTLAVSIDGGKTWSRLLSLWRRRSAYSDLVVLADGDVLCLYETGKVLPYSGIALTFVKRESISNCLGR